MKEKLGDRLRKIADTKKQEQQREVDYEAAKYECWKQEKTTRLLERLPEKAREAITEAATFGKRVAQIEITRDVADKAHAEEMARELSKKLAADGLSVSISEEPNQSDESDTRYTAINLDIKI